MSNAVNRRKSAIKLISFILIAVAVLAAIFRFSPFGEKYHEQQPQSISSGLADIPEFSGKPYILINNNKPEFSESEITDKAYEQYSELDSLGRCGTAQACIGTEIMPIEDRDSIGQIRPSGWQTVKYDIVDGKYLFNRCHLIGYQLTGENANEKNLITGTRYMNTEGMLPFENMVTDYIKETQNHVMYRVTPVFKGENLVASGVQIQALSVEDGGSGISFNIYVYNCQPQINIDYTTGESHLTESAGDSVDTDSEIHKTYILNTNTKKFHLPECSSAAQTKPENKEEFTGNRQQLVKENYEPCSICKP